MKNFILYTLPDCIGCKVIERHLAILQASGDLTSDINIRYVTVDYRDIGNSDELKMHNITDFPTFIFLDVDNNEVDRLVGSCPYNDVKEFIERC